MAGKEKEVDRALITHATALWNHGMRAPMVDRLPSTEIIQGFHIVAIDEVMNNLLSHDIPDASWLQSCQYFLDTILNGLADNESYAISEKPLCGIKPIMLANGGLVRARLGVTERMFDVPNAAKNMLKKIKDPSPLTGMIIGKLAIGPWDADFRVVMGERKRKLVFDSLQHAILKVFHFDNALNFENLPDGSCTFNYYLQDGGYRTGEIYAHARVQLLPLDNGSFIYGLN